MEGEKQNMTSTWPSIVTTDSSSLSATTVQSMTAVVRNSLALDILLPLCLLSIIINAILVGFGVYACNRLRKRSKYDSHLQSKQHNNQMQNASLNSTQ